MHVLRPDGGRWLSGKVESRVVMKSRAKVELGWPLRNSLGFIHVELGIDS